MIDRLSIARHCAFAAVAVCMMVVGGSVGQDYEFGENTDYWPGRGNHKVTGEPLFEADSMFLGATFLRDASRPLEVWYNSNSAWCTGWLYFMVPGYEDSAYALFTNKSEGARVRLDTIFDIPHLDTIFFKYKVDIDTRCADFDGNPKNYPPDHDSISRFTGPNRGPGDICSDGNPCSGVDRYYAPVDRDAVAYGIRLGRRFSVAGWVTEDGERTDTAQFAFEDKIEGDGSTDYNDIVFKISGIFLMSPPDSLAISVNSDTIQAGQTTDLTADLFMRSGTLPPEDTTYHDVQWDIVPSSREDGDTLYADAGRTTTFSAKVAYRTAKVIATYFEHGSELVDTAFIYVEPGPPDHLVIEGQSRGSLIDDDPIGGNGEVRIGSGSTTANAYAIVRDEFGNYIGPSTSTAWDTLPGPDLVVKAENGAKPDSGQGLITKTADNGETRVTAHHLVAPNTGPAFRDTILAIVDPAVYTALRIVNEDRVWLDELTIAADRDTLLILQGRREDDPTRWDNIQADQWTISPARLFSGNPPAQTDQWRFAPSDTGSGTLGAQRSGMSTSIDVTILPGSPHHVLLYDFDGNLHPSRMTRAAGDTVDMELRVFDVNDVLLTAYRLSPGKDEIVWSLTDPEGGSGRLFEARGHRNRFLPRIADRTATIFGKLPAGVADTLRDSLSVTIRAGIPDSLVVISDTSSLAKFPDDRIVFTITQDAVNAYTAVYDKFGNFVSFGYNTVWTSRRPADIQAKATTNYLWGEGEISRATDQEAEALIVASFYDDLYTNDSLYASVIAQISAVTYDSLRIFVDDGGTRHYVDTVQLRMGAGDTTLYVEGLRSDEKGWEGVPASWNAAASLGLTPSSLDYADQWTISAGDVTSGTISVSGSRLTEGAVGDDVFIEFLPGFPNRIAIYGKEGNPRNLSPLPARDTIAAGGTSVLVAKVFYDDEWFSRYEIADTSTRFISWEIDSLSGPAPAENLTDDLGHITRFKPENAFNLYRITARYRRNDISLSASVRIYVEAGAPEQLVIEQSPDWSISPNNPRPYDPIVFNATESVKYGYALLRDAFGNFAGYSTETDWRTRDSAIVTVDEGARWQEGEGEIERIGDIGQTRIIARNRNTPTLIDSATVRLDSVSYLRVRIVLEDSLEVDRLTITAGKDTLVSVQGLRAHDSTWVPVPGDWTLQPSTLDDNPGQAESFTFSPQDPATGRIIAEYPGAVSDTLPVTVRSGEPNSLVLYPKEGAPAPEDPTNDPYPRTITDTAGTRIRLVAKLFFNQTWLDTFERSPRLGSRISWSILEHEGVGDDDSSGYFVGGTTSGHKVTYVPLKAHRSVSIIAAYERQELVDTLTVDIVPGEPTQLVLEPDPDWRQSPNDPNPIDTAKITDSTLTTSVYALLRDSLGNFVRYSNPTTWAEVPGDPDIVDVATGRANRGEGTIYKDITVDSGLTRIYGVDDATKLRDTTRVQLLPYHYVKLRIGAGDASTVIEGNTLTINTNQRASLVVEGLRSDTARWEPVPGKWEMIPSITFDTPPPRRSSSWSFSPVDTGSGIIKATYENAAPDSIDVVFTAGPPTRIDISLLTPPERRIAGDTLKAAVTLYNLDGVYQGDTCVDLTYQDILGANGRPDPEVITDRDTTNLDLRPGTDYTARTCFTAGIDTVGLILYYAPLDPDSTHKVYVVMDTLEGSTRSFELLPGALDSLALVHSLGDQDSVTIRYPDGRVQVTALGFDRFGNQLRSEVKSNWSTTGTLHDVGGGVSSRILYTAAQVTSGEEGRLVALADENPEIGDSLFITIIGPTAQPSAVTRDTSANGYLDRIELSFSKPVVLPDTSVIPFFTIVNVATRDTLEVIDIEGLGDSARTTFTLVLEESAGDRPQTGWRPEVSFDNRSLELDGIDTVATVRASDGAGPVVWKVQKYVEDVDDRTKDLVTVQLSESIIDTNTSSFKISSATPASLFHVWSAQSDTVDSLLEGFLDGIEKLYRVGDDGTVVEFYMTNGAELSRSHKLSIVVDTTGEHDVAEVIDARGNYPLPHNVPVPVEVFGKLGNRMEVGPNPITPTMKHHNEVHDKPLHPIDPPEKALQWAHYDGGGAIKVEVVLSSDTGQASTERITGEFRIHDVAGNLVYFAENTDNLIPRDRRGAEGKHQLIFYWDGVSDQGRKVAPGVYRATLYLEYHTSKGTSRKPYHSTIGVSR